MWSPIAEGTKKNMQKNIKAYIYAWPLDNNKLKVETYIKDMENLPQLIAVIIN